MHRNFRRAAITALLIASLAPGLAQAGTFKGSPRALAVVAGHGGGFFNSVWSLLTDALAGRVLGAGLGGSLIVAKDDTGDNGGHLDPNGATLAAPAAPTGPDNGGHLDPNG